MTFVLFRGHHLSFSTLKPASQFCSLGDRDGKSLLQNVSTLMQQKHLNYVAVIMWLLSCLGSK